MIFFYWILELFRQCGIFLFNISFIYTMIFRSKSNISISRYENSRETNSIIVAWHSLKTHSHTSLPFSKHSLLTAHYIRPEVYFQSQQNAFSKHSLHTAGYFQSHQNAFSKHSLHPAGYFQSQQNAFSKHSLLPAVYCQSQQHAIHSPNAHYTRRGIKITTACHSFSKYSLIRRGIFSHNSMPFILQMLITLGGVFSITTACHSFSKRSLHTAGYFQSQQHAINSSITHYTRWGIFNHNSMPFILQILITPGGVFSITTACHSPNAH
jgi:hypothetical protein